MKNFRELTDEQLTEIAKLALESVIGFDFLSSLVKGQLLQKGVEIRIEKEIYDTDKNTGREYMVARCYAHGLGNTHCTLWEVDEPNYIDIDVINDNEPDSVSNQVVLIKKLIDWGFV